MDLTLKTTFDLDFEELESTVSESTLIRLDSRSFAMLDLVDTVDNRYGGVEREEKVREEERDGDQDPD